MKKAVRRILSVFWIVILLVGLISCGSGEADQTAQDPNALNPEEKLLVESLINVMFKRETYDKIKEIEDYDMPTLRVTEIGDRLDYSQEEDEKTKGGIIVKVQIQVKSLKDGSASYRRAFYFAIKGFQNEKWKAENKSWIVTNLKEHFSPKVYPRGYAAGPVSSVSYPEMWCMEGDFFMLYDERLKVGVSYEGMSVAKINQALKEHWENLGVL